MGKHRLEDQLGHEQPHADPRGPRHAEFRAEVPGHQEVGRRGHHLPEQQVERHAVAVAQPVGGGHRRPDHQQAVFGDQRVPGQAVTTRQHVAVREPRHVQVTVPQQTEQPGRLPQPMQAPLPAQPVAPRQHVAVRAHRPVELPEHRPAERPERPRADVREHRRPERTETRHAERPEDRNPERPERTERPERAENRRSPQRPENRQPEPRSPQRSQRRSHRLEEPKRTGVLGFRRRQDDLYERSFRFCTRCGNEVYVLANGCRTCGDAHALTPAPAC